MVTPRVKRSLLTLALLAVACTSSPPRVAPPPLETLERTVGVGDGPIVVMLHGYSSAPEHFLGLADRTDLPAGTLLVLPRAPDRIPGVDHGTMWWPLPDDLQRITHERLEGMDVARERVSALLDHLARAHPGRPIVLGGFSQGAMVSLDLALHDDRPLAGLALLSGTFVDEPDTVALLDRRHGQRVYVSHGTSDDVLRYEDDAALVEAMRAHQLDVRFTSFPGGHVVTPEVSTELAGFVTRCASAR